MTGELNILRSVPGVWRWLSECSAVIVIPSPSFGSILHASPHLRAVTLDSTLQARISPHPPAPRSLPVARMDWVEERGEGFVVSVWGWEGRVAAGRPTECLCWDTSFTQQIHAGAGLGAGIRR